MGMKKREKKVLNAGGQVLRDGVLDEAKAEMSAPAAKSKKRVRAAALASVCVAIIAVLVCIPIMIPHRAEAPQYVTNEELTKAFIDREELSREVLLFDCEPLESALYEYRKNRVFYRESLEIEQARIEFVVKFAAGNGMFVFQAEEDIRNGAPQELQTETLSGRELAFGSAENTFISFSEGECEYYLSFDGATSNWREILQNYLF